MNRTAEVERRTAETEIIVKMDLDGTGQADIHTGIGFFDHMLHQIARHGMIDLYVKCEGDLWIDGHHSIEDIGIAMGRVLLRRLAIKPASRVSAKAVCPLMMRFPVSLWISRAVPIWSGTWTLPHR